MNTFTEALKEACKQVRETGNPYIIFRTRQKYSIDRWYGWDVIGHEGVTYRIVGIIHHA